MSTNLNAVQGCEDLPEPGVQAGPGEPGDHLPGADRQPACSTHSCSLAPPEQAAGRALQVIITDWGGGGSRAYFHNCFLCTYVMFLMRADPLRGQVEIEIFWALWNCIEPLGECYLGPKKVEISRAEPPPICPVINIYFIFHWATNLVIVPNVTSCSEFKKVGYHGNCFGIFSFW